MAAERICAVCKADCSTSERLKDKKGRYFHKGCYERAKKAAMAKQKRAQPAGAPKRAAAARAPAARAPAAVPANLSCANCTAMMAPGAVLCTSCGYNAQTGQMMQMLSAVKFDNTPEKKSSGGRKVGLPTGSLGSIVANPMIIAGCVAAVFLILFIMGRSNLGAAGIYVLGMFVISLAVWIWTLVDAFSEGATHGVLCLFCGAYTLYYLFAVSNNQNLKVAYGLNVLLFVGWMGLANSIENDMMMYDEDAGFYDDSGFMKDDSGFEVDDEFADDENVNDAPNTLEGAG